MSDENEEGEECGEEQEQERDSKEIPLAELRRQEQAGKTGGEGLGGKTAEEEDEEIPEEELDRLYEAHRVKMERRKAEKRD